LKDFEADRGGGTYFVDLFPKAVIRVSGAELIDNEAIAREHAWFYFQYRAAWQEAYGAILTWLYLIRMTGFPQSPRFRQLLKFNLLASVAGELERFIVIPGLEDEVMNYVKPVAIGSRGGELSISMPWPLDPGRPRVEFGVSNDTDYGAVTSPDTRRVPLASELSHYGLLSLETEGNFDVAVYDDGTDTDMALWNANSTSKPVGLVPRYVWRNVIKSIGFLRDTFGPYFGSPNTDLARVFIKHYGLLSNNTFNFSALAEKARSVRPLDGEALAKEYMDPHDLPDAIPALHHDYADDDLSARSLQRMPISASDNLDALTPAEFAVELEDTDLDTKAANYAAHYPWVGFVVGDSLIAEIAQFSHNLSHNNAGSIEYFLRSIERDEAAWINYSYYNGLLTNKASQFDATSENLTFLYDALDTETDAAQDEWKIYNSAYSIRAVRANFRELLGQVIHYSVMEGDLMKGIEKLNEQNGQFYLDPNHVRRGVFMPQRKFTPIISQWDIGQMGFVRIDSWENRAYDAGNSWAAFVASSPFEVGFTPGGAGRTLTCLQEDETETALWTAADDDLYTAIQTSIWDHLTFVGLAPFFKVEEAYRTLHTFRFSEHAVLFRNDLLTILDYTELPSLLASQLVGLPVPIGFRAIEQPELNRWNNFAVTEDGSVIAGPHVSAQPLLSTADFLKMHQEFDTTAAWDLSDLISGAYIMANSYLDLEPSISTTTRGGEVLLPSLYPTGRRQVPEMLLNPIQELINVFVSSFPDGISPDEVMTHPALKTSDSPIAIPTLAAVMDVQKVRDIKPEFDGGEKRVGPSSNKSYGGKKNGGGRKGGKRPSGRGSYRPPRKPESDVTDHASSDFPPSETSPSKTPPKTDLKDPEGDDKKRKES
jgi:hypothetical protein